MAEETAEDIPHDAEPYASPSRASSQQQDSGPPPRNAFTELMQPQTKRPSSDSPDRRAQTKQHSLSSTPLHAAAASPKALAPSDTAPSPAQIAALGRDGLGAYLANPASFLPNIVLFYDERVVVLYDAYPKSVVHVLVIPRPRPGAAIASMRQNPIEAFDRDPELLQSCRDATDRVTALVASELRRRFGRYSKQDGLRRQAMESAEAAELPPSGSPVRADSRDPSVADESLPPGRDWRSEVIAGVHAGPSMSHLHVHVLSRDRHAACLHHRKHYNSFATPFFIRLDEFPLAPDDVRRRPDHGGYLSRDLACWRCNRNFGNRFKELKAHLDEVEFPAWRDE